MLKINQKLFGVVVVKIGCSQFGQRTLKLTVSEESADELNRFFSCCYRFRKAKSCFNDFRVGKVQNEHYILVHETVKSAIP